MVRSWWSGTVRGGHEGSCRDPVNATVRQRRPWRESERRGGRRLRKGEINVCVACKCACLTWHTLGGIERAAWSGGLTVSDEDPR